MKTKEPSKLEQELEVVADEGLEALADYVRKLVEKASDNALALLDECYTKNKDATCWTIPKFKMREAVMSVIPKDEPMSPFGCSCWQWVNSSWVRDDSYRKYCLVAPRPDATHCERCGKPRV